jgi:hypothetical protein
MRLRLVLALALTALAAVLDAGAQCAMCRTVVTASPEGQRLSLELNRAILILVAAPYGVFAALAWGVAGPARRAQARAWVRRRLGAAARRLRRPRG